MNSTFKPLPSPGLAIIPRYQAQDTTRLSLRRGGCSSAWEVYLPDGTLLLTIDGSSWSMSSRKKILDMSGNIIGQIRRDTHSLRYRYYFQTSDSGERLWEVTNRGWSGTRNEIKFINGVDGGRKEALEFKESVSQKHGVMKWNDREVARADAKSIWKLKSQVEVQVAAGMDMLLVVGIVVALDDMHRTDATVAAVSSS